MPIKTVKKATVAKKEHEEFGGVMENMAKASEQGTKDMLKDLEKLGKINDLLEYFNEIKHKYSKEEIKKISKKIYSEEITKRKQIPKPDEFGGTMGNMAKASEQGTKDMLKDLERLTKRRELKEYFDEIKHKYSDNEIKEIRKKIKNEEITKKKQIPKPEESYSSSSESEEEKPKIKINKKLHALSEEQEEDAEVYSSMMKKGKQSLADLKKEAHELFTNTKKRKIYRKVLDMLLKDEEISDKKYEKYNGYLSEDEFEKVEKLVNKYPELLEKASEKKPRTKPRPKLDSESDEEEKPKIKINKKLHLLSEKQEEDAEILSSMMKKGKQSLADLKTAVSKNLSSIKKMKIYGKVLDMLLDDEEISETKYKKYKNYLGNEEFEKVEKLVNKYPELIEKASVVKLAKKKVVLDSDSDDDL